LSIDPGSVSPVVLSLKGISKRFGAVQALDDVSMDCRSGEIHGVVGENGSGKSTLLGIASGVLTADAGEIEIAGRAFDSASAGDAQAYGLGMAYQTFSGVLELSVAENIYMSTPRAARPSFRGMEAWAASVVKPHDLKVDVSAPMGSLPLAKRQMLEVVKALQSEPKVLVMDEPTTSLGPDEVERLHALVLDLAARGVGVIYVSHRLPEVLSVVHRVTVLRDGVGQGTYKAADMPEDRLVAMMIGRPLAQAFPDRAGAGVHEETILDIAGLRGERFGPIDLKVRKGEILGVAGAEGNGQLPFLHALAGVERSNGAVTCGGRKVDVSSPPGPLRSGIVLLSGERARESVFTVLGVRANATLQVLRRFTRVGWIRRSAERDTVDEVVERLRIRTASIEQPVQYLSGGNQQKVALTRPFLRGDVNVIIAIEPTQGVDVGSRFDIYEALRAKAGEGVSVLVKSSDPIELSGICDRVLVMSRGRIIDELDASELNEKAIVEAMVGSKATTRQEASL
jgi:ribose transport system ATP-binding protein